MGRCEIVGILEVCVIGCMAQGCFCARAGAPAALRLPACNFSRFAQQVCCTKQRDNPSPEPGPSATLMPYREEKALSPA